MLIENKSWEKSEQERERMRAVAVKKDDEGDVEVEGLFFSFFALSSLQQPQFVCVHAHLFTA